MPASVADGRCIAAGPVQRGGGAARRLVSVAPEAFDLGQSSAPSFATRSPLVRQSDGI